jgi:hypothetical protein
LVSTRERPDNCERETDTSRVIVGGGAARRRYLPYGSSTDPVNHPGQVETIAGSRFPGGGRPESCKNTHDEYVLNVESGTRTPPTKCKKYKSRKVQSRKGSGRFSRCLEEILICDVRVESVRFETFLRVKIGCIKEWCVCLYNQRCHFDTKAVLFKYFVNYLFQLSLKADMILFLTDQKSHNNTKYTDIHMFSPSSVAY